MNKFKILILKNNFELGLFKIYPIYTGYSITIGNTIRRVLLSSLYGYSISYFKINNIIHEFSYIKGIIEDVTEITLNLKKIKFKIKNKKKKKDKEIINININNKKNKVYAGDIENFTNYFEVINKNLIICNKDESINFNITIIIEKGKGYIPSEEKKKYEDFIPIDSIYTPILKVSFKEKYYKKNLEILKIKILTNGSISPIKSLIKASKILIKIFNIFSKKKKYLIYKKIKNLKEYDIKILKIKKLLNTKLSNEKFSVRTINCLNKNKIYKWKDLVILTKSDLLKIKNFGKKSFKELINKMNKKKLNFKMNIKKYN
ncbi:MAG: DNA-directed RNA polymerase subunit alpha [Candidatus Shikimatogenerans bostrichidophilus]|nr:MAG: DNA-directed RNA polymerase subunit alpha [Candidatus Shikimatogenerans bostrichidophilus]